MSYSLIVSVFIITIIIWIYYFQFTSYETKYKIFSTNLAKQRFLKTGDMILFKAYDNMNAPAIGCYFTHIGMVYRNCTCGVYNGMYDNSDKTNNNLHNNSNDNINDNDHDVIYNNTINSNNINTGRKLECTCRPYLFEAMKVNQSTFNQELPKNGVYCTDLIRRIEKYKGKCYWKPLNHSISDKLNADFKYFIKYCIANFNYDEKVFRNGTLKKIGYKTCDKDTDCGQIMFLSLMRLGLLDKDLYDEKIMHHLKWMCDIKELNNNHYRDPIEILVAPLN